MHPSPVCGHVESVLRVLGLIDHAVPCTREQTRKAKSWPCALALRCPRPARHAAVLRPTAILQKVASGMQSARERGGHWELVAGCAHYSLSCLSNSSRRAEPKLGIQNRAWDRPSIRGGKQGHAGALQALQRQCHACKATLEKQHLRVLKPFAPLSPQLTQFLSQT